MLAHAFALLLALGVVGVAGEPAVAPCEQGEVVVVDFSSAEVTNEGLVRFSVSGDGVMFLMLAYATLPGNSLAKVNLYDTSAATGVDPDLDIANVGNAVIIQNDNAVVPNDSANGGTLVFAPFLPPDASIFVTNIKLLDIEVDTTVSSRGRSV